MDQEKIKELLKDCKTEEEAMKVLADNKIELTDEELEELRGGTAGFIDCISVAVGVSVGATVGSLAASLTYLTVKSC